MTPNPKNHFQCNEFSIMGKRFLIEVFSIMVFGLISIRCNMFRYNGKKFFIENFAVMVFGVMGCHSFLVSKIGPTTSQLSSSFVLISSNMKGGIANEIYRKSHINEKIQNFVPQIKCIGNPI